MLLGRYTSRMDQKLLTIHQRMLDDVRDVIDLTQTRAQITDYQPCKISISVPRTSARIQLEALYDGQVTGWHASCEQSAPGGTWRSFAECESVGADTARVSFGAALAACDLLGVLPD